MSCFSVSIRRGRRDRTSGFTRDFYDGLEDYIIPHPYNRAFIAHFSQRGIITRQFPRNMSERIRRTNGFRTGCAQSHAYFTTARDKAFNKGGNCFTRIYSRDTRGGGSYRFSFTDLSARVQLSSSSAAIIALPHALSTILPFTPEKWHFDPVIIIFVTSFSCLPICQNGGIHSRDSFSRDKCARTEYVNMYGPVYVRLGEFRESIWSLCKLGTRAKKWCCIQQRRE